ncbi:MAG: alpha/beta hydrolase [Proteobacteria bacterium]|nr:alpha/beta hydrolase [Pseudomonadota bacterium]
MGRGWAVLGVALALAGCGAGDAADPFVESRTPATLSARFYPPEGWGWGLVQVGDGPPQRYGVSAPATTVRAQILILPDYGESAETWFETASNLNARGYVVWVLDGAGQGGSGRPTGPRDLGYAKSFNPDEAAARAMISTVIRPTPTEPLYILGQGVGGLVAVRAMARGASPAGLILSTPALDGRPGGATTTLEMMLFGHRRVGDQGAWRRDGPDDFAAGLTHDPWRGRTTHLWQTANPDLRMGGPSVAWVSAFNAAAGEARDELKGVKAPVIVLEGDAAKGCRALPRCEARAFPGGAPRLELERDAVRSAWLEAIDGFIRAHASPPHAG